MGGNLDARPAKFCFRTPLAEKRETPKTALSNKQKIKKKQARAYFFWRAGADVRRFPVLFFLPPLGL
jgi:hypothetical protein